MCSVRIVADAGCDLSAAAASLYGIEIVPVFITFGQEMISSDDISLADFWARARSSPQLPGSAAPAPAAFQKIFRRLVSAGHEVVCLTLPGKHSGTFNSAWLAAQEFGERVRVVDSGSISLGIGLQVLRAAREALAGHGADAIQRMLEEMRERTSVIFALDTLEWVRRGGRLARLMPLIERLAQTLNVKPVVELRNSEFRFVGVARSMRGALQRIEDEVRALLPIEAAAAAYTRGNTAGPELAARLSALLGPKVGDIELTEAGAAFAVHAGPGAVGAVVVRA